MAVASALHCERTTGRTGYHDQARGAPAPAARHAAGSLCGGHHHSKLGGGELYLTGTLEGSATFGDLELRSAGGRDAFVAKLVP